MVCVISYKDKMCIAGIYVTSHVLIKDRYGWKIYCSWSNYCKYL